MGIVEQYLLQLKKEKRRLRCAAAILTVLSLFVATGVSWNLRMTGITLVNDASCGQEEHRHTEECPMEKVLICGYDLQEVEEEPAEEPEEESTEEPAEEVIDPLPDSNPEAAEPRHIHVDECYQIEYRCGYEEHLHSLACYSNPNADVESYSDWGAMFADYPYTGDLHLDLVGIAKMQVGYAESTRNFEADDDEVRHGYTRYGAWYGAPYNEWSAMFVSFCLHYAGADPSEYPINSGANTMAGLWDALGRYAQAGEYFPAVGDLVFFEDNTVGIVAEVQNATMYVIRGDVQDSVNGSIMSVNDDLIAGWGMIEKPVIDEPITDEPVIDGPIIDESIIDDPIEDPFYKPIEDDCIADEIIGDEIIADEPVYEETIYFSTGDPYDISNGPVFFMYAKTVAPMETDQYEPEPELQEQTNWQQYSLLKNLFNNDEIALAPRVGMPTNLVKYLEGKGFLSYTLMTKNDEPILKDENGYYVVTANEGYKLLLTIESKVGIESGTYSLQLPEGLMYEGGTGSITLKDVANENNEVTVGTWEVFGDGRIIIEFNEEMNSLTENFINATIGVHFPEANTRIEFDGEVIVTVKPPDEQANPTIVQKAGEQGKEEKGEDPSKIYWKVYVEGGNGSNIVGNTLSDSVVFGAWSKTHRYTDSDIEKGLHFGVWGDNDWHEWTVPSTDPNLNWTETGWTYVMPTTSPVICKYCQRYIDLGNDGWTYTVSYTSTPEPINISGKYGYENVVSIDGKTDRGWVVFAQGASYGNVEKTGTLVSDASGSDFVWELQITIPGWSPGKKADYYWYLTDNLYRYMPEKGYDYKQPVHNDANLSVVTAQYQGVTVNVPNFYNATANDMFAWYVTWSAKDANGVEYGREIALLSRCHCNENNCQFWNGRCGGKFWGSNEFCHCWTAEEDVTFTFSYKTNAVPLIEDYGGQGYLLQNVAELYYKADPDTDAGVPVGSKAAEQAIPGVFKKDLIDPFDGYTARYKITVNEAKIALTNGEEPLIINDSMSNTMTYMSGSMVIKTEDANGNVGMLQQGEHYTVIYDGSGKDAHILKITILNPQPVMYILEYDTTLFKPESHEGGSISYSNFATITLWGDTVQTDIIEKFATKFNMAAKTYAVKLHKTCALTKKALAGAVFGVYNPDGGLVVEGETDEDGYLNIQTDLKAGIIFKEHDLYYAQEHTPPAAYMLDDKKNWFIFCNSKDQTCDTCNAIIGDRDAVRIPLEQIGNMDIKNEPISYELPATGGIGTPIYILSGLILTSAPLVYGLSLRRKYERRSRG